MLILGSISVPSTSAFYPYAGPEQQNHMWQHSWKWRSHRTEHKTDKTVSQVSSPWSAILGSPSPPTWILRENSILFKPLPFSLLTQRLICNILEGLYFTLGYLTHNSSSPPPTRSHCFYEYLINQSPKVNTTNYPLLCILWFYLSTTGTELLPGWPHYSKIFTWIPSDLKLRPSTNGQFCYFGE